MIAKIIIGVVYLLLFIDWILKMKEVYDELKEEK